MPNYAYIDGQNLKHNTSFGQPAWQIDLRKLRLYLQRKYQITTAYYFIGAYLPENARLYKSLTHYGYRIIFRKHGNNALSQKKGNVDTDIVFAIMHDLIDDPSLEQVVLVSGDGDYWRVVDYLIRKNRLAKLLAPNHHHTSSLYRRYIPDRYISYLDDPAIKRKLLLHKRQAPRDKLQT